MHLSIKGHPCGRSIDPDQRRSKTRLRFALPAALLKSRPFKVSPIQEVTNRRFTHTSFIPSGSHPTTAPRSMLRLPSSAAPAARKPNTASSTTGWRERTDAKKFLKWS